MRLLGRVRWVGTTTSLSSNRCQQQPPKIAYLPLLENARGHTTPTPSVDDQKDSRIQQRNRKSESQDRSIQSQNSSNKSEVERIPTESRVPSSEIGSNHSATSKEEVQNGKIGSTVGLCEPEAVPVRPEPTTTLQEAETIKSKSSGDGLRHSSVESRLKEAGLGTSSHVSIPVNNENFEKEHQKKRKISKSTNSAVVSKFLINKPKSLIQKIFSFLNPFNKSTKIDDKNEIFVEEEFFQVFLKVISFYNFFLISKT